MWIWRSLDFVLSSSAAQWSSSGLSISLSFIQCFVIHSSCSIVFLCCNHMARVCGDSAARSGLRGSLRFQLCFLHGRAVGYRALEEVKLWKNKEKGDILIFFLREVCQKRVFVFFFHWPCIGRRWVKPGAVNQPEWPRWWSTGEPCSRCLACSTPPGSPPEDDSTVCLHLSSTQDKSIDTPEVEESKGIEPSCVRWGSVWAGWRKASSPHWIWPNTPGCTVYRTSAGETQHQLTSSD